MNSTPHIRPALTFVLLVALLPAGLLRADTVVVRTADGTSRVDGTVESVDATELVFIPLATGQRSRVSVDAVLQIKAPAEPDLTGAEQAFADGKWEDAVAKYQRTVKVSISAWAKYRATVRLIDAAGKSHQFDVQVSAYIDLARLDPANAKAHRPPLADVKAEQIGTAMESVKRADAAGLPEKSAAVLTEFLADLDAAKDPAPVFAGITDAKSIIFVCDASGSMLNKMASLKNGLSRTITKLGPEKSFNVIFLQDEKCVAFEKAGTVSANADNKRMVGKFLDDVTTSGTTDPIPGLTLAFQQRPQLIYLLTDGDFPDNKAVKAIIAKLNAARKITIKINTIAFVNNNDTDTDFLRLLEDIAADNGGTYKHVEENKLQE